MKNYSLVLICLVICISACQNHSQKKPASNPAISSLDLEKELDQTFNKQVDSGHTIATRFETPVGYERKEQINGSYPHYLNNFPLLPPDAKVHLYDGSLKYDQDVHAAVLDIDVGSRDLQQCADAIMRLRSEYLYKEKLYNDISFNFTNGWKFEYSKWRKGNKLIVKGNKTYWEEGGSTKSTYDDFRSYLNQVFMYAGTLSLSKELKSKNIEDIEIGDLLIQGGSPGHAVLVVDMCENPITGDKAIMLAQSYMPAQQIHILKNKTNATASPWYLLSEVHFDIVTPEWTFSINDVKTF